MNIWEQKVQRLTGKLEIPLLRVALKFLKDVKFWKGSETLHDKHSELTENETAFV